MNAGSKPRWPNVSPERRRVMQAVRSKNTKPELHLRSLLHRNGYRFRLHRRSLPGTPDLVFPSRRKAIEVRGCFWHCHPGCARARLPATRRDYWVPKLEANCIRDVANELALAGMGWHLLVVWECEMQKADEVIHRVRQFLGKPGADVAASDIAGRRMFGVSGASRS